VELELREDGSDYRFTVSDDGRGMDAAELARAADPFVTDGAKHPGRRVGLGLPFLLQTAEQSGGGAELRSEKGKGTVVSARFDAANIDFPPEGDVPGLFRTAFMFGGPKDVAIRRFRRRAGLPTLDYGVRRSELEDALGGLGDAGALVLLGRYLASLEEAGDGGDSPGDRET